MQVFTYFLTEESCPNFVLADVERARRHEESTYCSDEEENIDSAPTEQPEWMDFLAPNPDFDYNNSPDFVYDDGEHDYDQSSETSPYPEDKGIKFIEGLNLQSEDENVSNTLILPDVSHFSLNDEQTFAHNLVLNTLLQFINDPLNFQPLRMIVAGTAGSGKSFF